MCPLLYVSTETALIELFVTKSHAEIMAGKEQWEAAHDKSLLDHLDEELTNEYKHLQVSWMRTS